MSNFEYIIASLPFLTQDFKYAGGQGFENVIEEIRENLGEKDSQALDFLLNQAGEPCFFSPPFSFSRIANAPDKRESA